MITLTLLKSDREAPSETVKAFPDQVGPSEMLWVDAESPRDQEMADLKQRFNLDEYAVEDVVNRNQRPKMEDYGKTCSLQSTCPLPRVMETEIVELFVFFQKKLDHKPA